MTSSPSHILIDTVPGRREHVLTAPSHAAHSSSHAGRPSPRHLLSLPPSPNEPHHLAQSFPPRRYGNSPLPESLSESLLADPMHSPSLSPSIDGASDLSLSSSDSFHSQSHPYPSKPDPSPPSPSTRTRHPPLSTSAELSTLLTIAYPIALSILCRTAQGLTDLSFLGHLSTDALASSSAALLVMNLTSAILYRAFGTAVNTLCAQAYGAENWELVGVWLQLSVVLNTLATIPLSISWWFTGDFLRLIGVEESLAVSASIFARWSIWSVWPILIYECLSRYFQAQGVVLPALVINFVLVFTNIFLNWLLIFGAGGWGGLGYVGSPLATAACKWILLIAFWGWMFLVRDSSKCWHG